MRLSTFSREYWRCACGEIKRLRQLTFAALICAISVVVGALYLTVGENLRVYFTFFVTATGCAVYGPVVGLLVAAATDTLNYILFPSGPYFPGYLLSEMLSAMIYSLLLYRKQITVLRLFTARFLVDYAVNVGLGSLWSRVLYGQGYLYYMLKSLVKNTLLLPIEVILLSALFAVLLPSFSRLGMLPGHKKRDLEKLSVSSSAFVVFGLDCLFGSACSFGYWLNSGTTVFVVLTGLLAAAGTALLILGPVLRKRKHRIS